jgi:hypothetical protein
MTPQEKRFIRRLTESIEELALFFINEPDEEIVVAALSRTKATLAVELIEPFGAEAAAQFADKFVATVVSRRRELLMN